MAANINDKITKTFDTVNPNVAKVTADRAPGSTTLQANNLAGWTEVTAEHFSTYRVDAQKKLIEGSQTDWKGIVNKATNTITNLTRVGGAEDSGSLVNDIIQAGPTAKWADDLADGILVTHNADGTLKNKVAALTKINGGSTDGVLLTDASGNVTGGKVTSDKLDSETRGDYSLTEVDTGRKWIDGKAIYKRTFTGTASLAYYSETPLTSGISSLVDFSGTITRLNGDYVPITAAQGQSGDGSKLDLNAYPVVKTTNALVMAVSKSSSASVTTHPYNITIYYTKV